MTTSRLPSTWPLRLLAIAALGILLAAAGWLRWRYLQDISLYVDEFTTLWAAKRVLATGAPIMPSGVIYTRGLLDTYVTALFTALGGPSFTVGRLPSLISGLAAIVAIFLVGRQAWNARTGWLAAVGLTLLPEAIVWSARARFYAQLQLFALLTIWSAWFALQTPADSAGAPASRRTLLGRQLLFAALFTVALFSQEQMVLLYPSLLAGMLFWRGWRYLLQPQVWAPQLLILAALAARYALEIVGQPGYFETIQARRPYVGLIFDPAAAWHAYAGLLIAPERLVWTVLAVLAVAVGLALLRRAHWRVAALPAFHQATLFFSLQFAFVLAVMLTLVGPQWRETRYLYIVQPLWLLTGAAGAVWGIDRLIKPPGWRWAATGAAAVALAALFWQPAQSVLSQQVEGYDRVLAAVAAQRRPGDVTMSPQPPACALVLGPCDYYAVQKVYEEFVIPKDGVLVDRWTGARLLNDAGELAQVIRTAPAVWLITDGFRLATRYDADFLRTVIEQFDVVADERGVMALKAQGWREPAPTAAARRYDPPRRLGPLALAGWSRSAAAPGQELQVTLDWQGAEPIDRQINTSLRIVDAAGQLIVQDDGPPARGILPTNLFFGTPVPDPKRVKLPADLPPGRYRIDVSAYDVDTVMPVAAPAAIDYFVVGPPPAAPTHQDEAHWQGGITLSGHDDLPRDLQPSGPLTLRLVWKTAATVPDDYTIFVHLLDPAGQVVAQSDRAPEGGFYPTSAWQPNAAVADTYQLTLPAALPAGNYRLQIGLYQPATGRRLPLANGGDTLTLASWTVH